jgi:hypothetical protein
VRGRAADPQEVDLARTLTSLRRLRPIAIEVVKPLMAQELHRATERAFERLATELEEAAAQSPEAS